MSGEHARRKLEEDGKRRLELELQDFQKIRHLGPQDEALNHTKYNLWRKYHTRIAYKFAWRWGVIVAVVLLTGYYTYSLSHSFDNFNIFSYSVPRNLLDPLALALSLSLAILTGNFCYIAGRKNDAPGMLAIVSLACVVVFIAVYTEMGFNEKTIHLPLTLPLMFLPAFIVSAVSMALTSSSGTPIVKLINRVYNGIIDWVWVKDP